MIWKGHLHNLITKCEYALRVKGTYLTCQRMRKVTGRQSLCKRCCYQEKKRNKKSNERNVFIDDIEINSKCSFVCRTRKSCGAHQKFCPIVKGDPLGFGWVVTYIHNQNPLHSFSFWSTSELMMWIPHILLLSAIFYIVEWLKFCSASYMRSCSWVRIVTGRLLFI